MSATSQNAPGVGRPSSKNENKTVTMTFHIDPELKQDVTEIVNDFGLSLTAVTRAFYKQIVREGSIPLSFRYDAKGIDEPNRLIGESEVNA